MDAGLIRPCIDRTYSHRGIGGLPVLCISSVWNMVSPMDCGGKPTKHLVRDAKVQWVEEAGESEGFSVMGRIGDNARPERVPTSRGSSR